MEYIVDGIKWQPILAPIMVDHGVISEPFRLIDVGASGGIGSWWLAFEPQLQAWGFDPIVQEVARLQAAAPPGVRYINAFVGCPEAQHLLPGPTADKITLKSNGPGRRWSCYRALEVADKDFAREMYNAGQVIETTSHTVSLDAFVRRDGIEYVDFLKVDTDGSDYEVLLGARNMLRACGVLGVMVEASFHGPIHPHAGTFSHIDTLMREAGFTLFDMRLYRYSRRDLPGEFVHQHPSNTKTGPVMWADVLYLRDFGDQHYPVMWDDDPAVPRLFKMIALLEMFGLDDCAVEVMHRFWERLEPHADLAAWRDRLVPVVDGTQLSYESFIAAFEQRARSWRRGATFG